MGDHGLGHLRENDRRLGHRAGRRAGIEAAAGEFMGMVVIVLADAEDIALRARHRRARFQPLHRDRIARRRRRLPFGRQVGQDLHAASGILRGQVKRADAGPVFGKHADAGRTIVLKGNNFHEYELHTDPARFIPQ
jgi:hypothetical protein